MWSARAQKSDFNPVSCGEGLDLAVPQNVPECPKMPHPGVILQNEPNASRQRSRVRNDAPADVVKCHEMSLNVANCQWGEGNLQNKPNSHRRRVGLDLFLGVVAAADQRAGFDVANAAGFALDLPGSEF